MLSTIIKELDPETKKKQFEHLKLPPFNVEYPSDSEKEYNANQQAKAEGMIKENEIENVKQPVYTSLPDMTLIHHDSVFSLDLDGYDAKKSLLNVRLLSPLKENEVLIPKTKEVPTLKENDVHTLPKLLAKRGEKGYKHLGGRKSKKNRRRGSRRRVRSSRRR